MVPQTDIIEKNQDFLYLSLPATGFQLPSATVVSAEPFSHGTGTLWCLQKEMVTYRHWVTLSFVNTDV